MRLWNCCEPSHTNDCIKNLSSWIRRCSTFEPAPKEQRTSPPIDNLAAVERALASFHAAVAKEYGAEQAAIAAQDWIEELQALSADTPIDWRSVTSAAAHRLAHRLLQPSLA